MLVSAICVSTKVSDARDHAWVVIRSCLNGMLCLLTAECRECTSGSSQGYPWCYPRLTGASPSKAAAETQVYLAGALHRSLGMCVAIPTRFVKSSRQLTTEILIHATAAIDSIMMSFELIPRDPKIFPLDTRIPRFSPKTSQ